MLRTIRTTLAVGAVSALTMGALIAPAIASAKTYKVTLKLSGKQTGVDIKGSIKGAPLGSCAYTGKLVIPNTNQVWKCKGGTIKTVGVGTTGASNDAKGTWKVTSGTGKFKGAKGSGTFSGQISTGLFTYVGKLSY
jgi:hypothetical protein